MGKLKNLEIEADGWEDDKSSRKAREIVKKLSHSNKKTSKKESGEVAVLDEDDVLSGSEVDDLSEVQGFPFIVMS